VIGFESENRSGYKTGCDAAVEMQLMSSGDGFWAEWADDLRLITGPEVLTSDIADIIQEFIEALVAKAAD
jgi:hypothetical protein